jgi:hypothetical protein
VAVAATSPAERSPGEGVGASDGEAVGLSETPGVGAGVGGAVAVASCSAKTRLRSQLRPVGGGSIQKNVPPARQRGWPWALPWGGRSAAAGIFNRNRGVSQEAPGSLARLRPGRATMTRAERCFV